MVSDIINCYFSIHIKVTPLGKRVDLKIWISLLLQGYENHATSEIVTQKTIPTTFTNGRNIHFDANMNDLIFLFDSLVKI